MIINRYQPKSTDKELLDFVNDITELINNGRVNIGTTAASPSAGQGSTSGEMRLYVNGSDVKLYGYDGTTWHGFQKRPLTQSGWGYVTISGTPAYQTASVTFPAAFDVAPYVICSYIGVKTGSNPSTPADIDAANTLRVASAYAPTTTGFTVLIQNTAGGAMTNTHRECFAWIAIATS